MSMEPNVVTLRLAGWLGWWQMPVGHGKEPGFFGLTFNLEIISKLPKSE